MELGQVLGMLVSCADQIGTASVDRREALNVNV